VGGGRESVSGRQVAFVLLGVTAAMAAGYWLAAAGFSPGSSLHMFDLVLALVIVALLVRPLTVLLHELGHAVAAVRLADRPATAIVGRGPWVSTKWGRVTVRFSLVPRPLRTQRGLCVYDGSGVPWRSIGWISLAGPIATAVTLGAVLAVAPGLWTTGVLARYIIFWTVVMLASDLIFNLDPRQQKPQAQAASSGFRDGWKARHALECHRKGLARPATRPSAASPASANTVGHASPVPEIPAEEHGALEAVLMNEFEQSFYTSKPSSSSPPPKAGDE
jgi:hypothetical protein